MKKLIFLFFISILIAHATLYSTGVTVSGSNPTTITMYASGSNGAATVGLMSLRPWPNNYPPTQTNAICGFQFDPVNHYFSMYQDDGTIGTNSGNAGDNKLLTNSRCSFPLNTASYNVSGNQVSFTVTLTVKSGSGLIGTPLHNWTFVDPAAGYPNENPTGWQDKGTWTAAEPPTPFPTSVSPASGSGSSQIFTVNISSTADWVDLSIGSGFMVEWHNGGWTYLYSDSGQAGTAYQIGSSTVLSNSQGILNLANSHSTVSGGTNFLTFSVTFSPSYAGSRTITAVSGGTGGNSGWIIFGSWTVPATLLSDISSVDTNTTVMLANDADDNPVRKPTNSQPWIVTTRDGRKHPVANAANIRVKKTKTSYEPVGDSFIYHLQVDTQDPELWGFRLGNIEDMFWLNDSQNTLSTPKGWSGGVFAWTADVPREGERSENSEFVIRSKWRPGLLPMYLASEAAKEPMPVFSSTEDNERMATASSIFNNSLRRFIIGPAIKPGITKAELDQLIVKWVEDYNFQFLKPLTEGKSLEELSPPESGFEQEILQCLRSVTPKV